MPLEKVKRNMRGATSIKPNIINGLDGNLASKNHANNYIFMVSLVK